MTCTLNLSASSKHCHVPSPESPAIILSSQTDSFYDSLRAGAETAQADTCVWIRPFAGWLERSRSAKPCALTRNKCLTSSNKKLLGAPGLTTRNKDATFGAPIASLRTERSDANRTVFSHRSSGLLRPRDHRDRSTDPAKKFGRHGEPPCREKGRCDPEGKEEHPSTLPCVEQTQMTRSAGSVAEALMRKEEKIAEGNGTPGTTPLLQDPKVADEISPLSSFLLVLGGSQG